ncbi:MAG TPA: hypothetical protein V6C81_19935 [Planktothrix sp.]|jgi:hypothetical protein
MPKRRLTGLSLIAASVLITAPAFAGSAVTEGTPAPAAKKSFSLSAQMTDRPQLSRTEIDSGAIAPIKQPASPAISYLGQSQAAQFRPPAARTTAATPPSGPPVDAAHASLLERNVDWSGWVSKEADRWYYMLRTFENGLNAQFVTERAALFQFTCYDDGRISNVMLRQSSGNVIYDHLQMLALMQTAPLLQFPAGTKRHSITLILGWESHIKQAGEDDYTPGSFGKNFPMEKVREWVKKK